MASLAVRIMAHHQRKHLALELASCLELSDDEIIWDRNDDRWDTGRRAWESMINSAAEWGCIIQDDAIVCQDFIAGMNLALDYVPNKCLVAPFNGTGNNQKRSYRLISEAVKRAEQQKACWIVMPTLMSGVALSMQTSMIADVMTWCDQQSWPEYDRRIGQHFLRQERPVYSMHPSLVEHRDDEPSLTGHAKGRMAHRFIGEEASALDIDWSGAAITIPGTPGRRR